MPKEVKPRERKFVFALVLIASVSAGVLGVSVAIKRHREWLDARWHYADRQKIEAREALKTPPVLVLNGTADGREFEIIMRGFTNYFRKETWGAPRGKRTLLGGQKPGGYAVEIRTADFHGQRQYGWWGTRRGGGGGGSEGYLDDLVPGRNLWSSSGFVGLGHKYERHVYLWKEESASTKWEEDCEDWMQDGDIRIPRKILLKESGGNYSSKWTHPTREFKIQGFKFQDEPSADWFEAQVKEHFPPHWIQTRTNTPADVVSGISTNK